MDGTNGRWYQVNLCAGRSSKNLVRSGPDATLETPTRARRGSFALRSLRIKPLLIARLTRW